MRIPLRVVEKEFSTLEHFLGEKLKVVGRGGDKKVVFRKEQWNKVWESLENKKGSFQINEASSLVLRAYGRVVAHGQSAKSSAAGRMALISAIVSIYNADPGLGSNLSFLLD
jgi:hypothetical protein